MTFTEKERFISHVATLSALDNMGLLGEMNGQCLKLLSLVKLVMKTRCRELTEQDVLQVFSDMNDEADVFLPELESSVETR